MKDKTKVIGRPLTEAEWAQLLAPQVKKHIAIEVNKVARRWHLGTEETKELGSHVVAELAMKVARNYDATQRNMNSFVRLVLPNILKNWKDEANQRGKTFVPISDIVSTQETATSFDECQILDALDLLAYENVEDSSNWRSNPFEMVAREDDREYTRWVIGRLSPLNQRICRAYIETPSLRMVARRLNIYYPHFNHTIWPACQKEFKKIWGKEEVFASNTPSRLK